MGMRLLKKSEISVAKAQEKRSEIEQGLQLAKRVDTLRQTAAEEEASLIEFRKKTVAQIHKEIGEVQIELDAVRRELETVKADRDYGTKKIDQERIRLEKKESELVKLAMALDKRSFEINEQHKWVISETERLLKEREDVTAMRKRAVGYTDKKEEDMKEASRIRREAEQSLNTISIFVAVEGKKLMEKEADLATHEAGIKKKAEELEKKATELNDREKQINDRYTALLQAEKHVDK